jgi:hypothetical protein
MHIEIFTHPFTPFHTVSESKRLNICNKCIQYITPRSTAIREDGTLTYSVSKFTSFLCFLGFITMFAIARCFPNLMQINFPLSTLFSDILKPCSFLSLKDFSCRINTLK